VYTGCPILKVASKYFFSDFQKKYFRQKLFGSKGHIWRYH